MSEDNNTAEHTEKIVIRRTSTQPGESRMLTLAELRELYHRTVSWEASSSVRSETGVIWAIRTRDARTK